MTLTLQNIEVDAGDLRLLKWKFAVRNEQGSVLVVAQSLRTHPVLVDLQRLGPMADVEWAPEIVEAITRRIAEELARIRFAEGRRAA